MEPTSPRLAWIDALLGFALTCYIVLGASSVAFHADEGCTIHASRLTMERIANRDLEALIRVADPSWAGFDPHHAFVALTVAPFHTYVIGAALYAAGLREADTGKGWTFVVDYEENVRRGHRPAARWLNIARLASTVFLCLGVATLYGLARTVAGRGVAIGAAVLYGLSPVVLVHGRRAMLEGPFMFFTLLTLLVAARLVGRHSRGDPISAAGWISLSLVSGVCVATKHTGAFFVAPAFAWVALSLWSADSAPARSRSFARLAGSGLLAIAVFGVLSPVVWADPVARIIDLGRMRDGVLRVQVGYYREGRVRSTGERLDALVRNPYLTPLKVSAVPAEGQRYAASPWSGVRLPAPLGWLATILAAVGLATAIQRGMRVGEQEHFYWGILAWTLASLGFALMDPLAWPRYHVPTLPLAYFLTALGASGLYEWSRSLRRTRV